jgi:hypothetical protein
LLRILRQGKLTRLVNCASSPNPIILPKPVANRIEVFVGLFVFVVLLLVVMPGLLYLMGWAVTRYTKKAPSWIGFPTRPREPGDKPDGRA